MFIFYFSLVLCFMSVVRADLPVECLYEDIAGEWQFFESERNGPVNINCNLKSKESCSLIHMFNYIWKLLNYR